MSDQEAGLPQLNSHPGQSGNRSKAEELFRYTEDVIKRRQAPFVLEYEFLQRLNLVAIQNDIARCNKDIWEEKKPDEEQLKTLRLLLSTYATAIRDYEYLRQLMPSSVADRDDRVLVLEYHFPGLADLRSRPHMPRYREILRVNGGNRRQALDPIRDVLRRKLPHFLTYSSEEKAARTPEYVAREPPESVSPFVDGIARFVVAFAGGAALVVPMLVMSFRPSQTKSVVTASVAVFLFSMSISLAMRASNTETLVATATYAAVLVVFVGASTIPQ